VTEEKTLGTAVADLVDRMFGGSPEELVMSLVKSRQLDAGRLAKLAERVDTAKAAKAAKGASAAGKDTAKNRRDRNG
jgi:hypothetical protein